MLLEVILSILIISSGVVLVLQSYLTSLKSIDMTNGLTKACFLLEDKLFDLDVNGFKGGVKEGESNEAVEGEDNYTFACSASPLDDKEQIKINKVGMSMFYKKGNQNRMINVSTFLKNTEG